MASTSSNVTLWSAVASMLFFGTTLALMKDWQVKMGFAQPYLWSTGIFFAQSFFLPFYYFTRDRASDGRKGSEQTKPPAPVHTYVLVTFFAFAAMVLSNAAYSGLPGSICQMLKGLKLVFTCFLSCTVLGKRLRSYQYLGVSLTVAGLALVGLASIAGEGTGWASPNETVVSLYMGIMACVIGALQFVWEEKTMKQYAVEPALLAGMQGIIGVAYGIIWLTVAGTLKLVDVPGALAELWHRKAILFSFVFLLFSNTMFGFLSLVVTSRASAMVRSLLDEARASCVWITEVYFGWERFLAVELAGFVIMVFGLMTYGDKLKVPFLAYDEEGPLLPVKQAETKANAKG